MRRRAGRARALAAAGGLAMGVATIGQATAYGAAEPGSGFGSFSLSANAPAVQFLEDNDNAATHPEGEGDVPEALSTLTAGPIGYALSSVAWPGSALGNLGSVLIVSGGGQVPDQATALNDPVRAEARNGDEPVANDSVPGAHMAAKVTDAVATAEGSLNGARAAGVYSAGATSAVSHVTLTGPASAVAQATTRLHDVSIAGGVVTLGSLTSTATATSDGARAAGTGKTSVSGMRVQGVPVTVDGDGVHVGPAGVGVPPGAAGSVQSVLDRLGLTIMLSRPEGKPVGGDVDFTAGSLVVVWKPPNSGNNETITLALGGATVSAHATRADLVSLRTGVLPAGPGPVSAPAPPTSLPPASSAAGGVDGSTPARAAPPSTEQAPAVATTPASSSLPPLPGPLSAAWVVLGCAGAVAFALGVLRQLPARVLAAPGGGCPRKAEP